MQSSQDSRARLAVIQPSECLLNGLCPTTDQYRPGRQETKNHTFLYSPHSYKSFAVRRHSAAFWLSSIAEADAARLLARTQQQIFLNISAVNVPSGKSRFPSETYLAPFPSLRHAHCPFAKRVRNRNFPKLWPSLGTSAAHRTLLKPVYLFPCKHWYLTTKSHITKGAHFSGASSRSPGAPRADEFTKIPE